VSNTVEGFLSLSEFLIGVPLPPPLPPITSLDPKLAETYLVQLRAWSVQGPFMEQLLATWDVIRDQPPDLRTASVEALIMADPNLGPLARQILLAWYTGFRPWSEGQQPTPSAANYSDPLVWLLSRGQPSSVPREFGYWHGRPKGAPS
jgi:hypothetical protein